MRDIDIGQYPVFLSWLLTPVIDGRAMFPVE